MDDLSKELQEARKALDDLKKDVEENYVSRARVEKMDAEFDTMAHRLVATQDYYEKAKSQIADMDAELRFVLSEWNDLRSAIGARTNGTAVVEAKILRARHNLMEQALRVVLKDLTGRYPVPNREAEIVQQINAALDYPKSLHSEVSWWINPPDSNK